MKLVTTGASNTTTFSVGFAVYRDRDRWAVAPPVFRETKGYRNSRYVWCLVPREEFIEVRVEGSANPRTGPTPEEFCDKPLECAAIEAHNLSLPIPDYDALLDLIACGVRELAEQVPGRFCPEPPCRGDWGKVPRLNAYDIQSLLNSEVGGMWVSVAGRLPLRGYVSAPVSQRAFFVSTHLTWFALACLQEPDPNKMGAYLTPPVEFYAGHHLVSVTGGGYFRVVATYEDTIEIQTAHGVEKHLLCDYLIDFYDETRRLRVTDLVTGEAAEAEVRGLVRIAHHPRFARD